MTHIDAYEEHMNQTHVIEKRTHPGQLAVVGAPALTPTQRAEVAVNELARWLQGQSVDEARPEEERLAFALRWNAIAWLVEDRAAVRSANERLAFRVRALEAKLEKAQARRKRKAGGF